MPIRINLLAEEQFLAEVRRRDPVKRAAFLGGFLVLLSIAWWGWLMFSKIKQNQQLEGHKASFTRIEKAAKEVADQQKRTTEIENNIYGLHRMVTNRVLWSGCLNALQECTVTVIQITRVHAEQTYTVQPAVLSKERGKSKPASSTERTLISITARDYGRPEERQYENLKNKLEAHPWFKQYLAKENPITFKGFTNPTPDKDDPNRVFVSFIIECVFNEQFRN